MAYFLDVKAGERVLNRFEVRFAYDDEAIRHSQELAANLRHRHFAGEKGLIIEVLDKSCRKIHGEIVHP
jgi:hypothetical protein